MSEPRLKDLLHHCYHSDRKSRIALRDTSGTEVSYAAYYLESVAVGTKLSDLCPSATKVCLLSEKSIASLILIQGILQIDACYIPLNPSTSFASNLAFFQSTDFDMLVISETLAPAAVKGDATIANFQIVGHTFYALSQNTKTTSETETNLAYILFTSGSTGTPKGVMVSHSSVLYFLDWCSHTFQPEPSDVFSSIAPWCFDLSILDIFLPIRHGSCLAVFSESETQNPRLLANQISDMQVTNIYATPTLLRSLTSFGQLHLYDFKKLKTVLFAGEVFPIRPLNALREIWPQATYYNLYGPTETNVCTYYKLPGTIEKNRETAYPIGKPCEGNLFKIKDESPHTLLISGPGVMSGYYQNAKATEQKMYTDQDTKTWYDTGDIVSLDDAGNLLFAGRADRQIKRKGYRIELDEIEAATADHEAINECAAIASQKGDDTIITVFVVASEKSNFSTQALREYLIERIENYKMPDKFVICDSLPKTISGKIDHTQLKNI